MVQSKRTHKGVQGCAERIFCGGLVLGMLLKYERKNSSGTKTPLMRTLLSIHVYRNKTKQRPKEGGIGQPPSLWIIDWARKTKPDSKQVRARDRSQ